MDFEKIRALLPNTNSSPHQINMRQALVTKNYFVRFIGAMIFLSSISLVYTYYFLSEFNSLVLLGLLAIVVEIGLLFLIIWKFLDSIKFISLLFIWAVLSTHGTFLPDWLGMLILGHVLIIFTARLSFPTWGGKFFLAISAIWQAVFVYLGYIRIEYDHHAYLPGIVVWAIFFGVIALGEILSHSFANTIEKIIQEREKSFQQYKSLFENSNDAVFIIGFDEKIIDVNQKGIDLLGYTKEELHDRSLEQLGLPARQREIAIKMLLSGRNIPILERRFSRKDGRGIDVEMNIRTVYDQSGSPVYFQNVVRDITERKNNIEKLIEIQQRYDSFYNNSHYCIILLDLNLKILEVNQYGANMLGYKPDELVGIDSHLIIAPEDLNDLNNKYEMIIKGDPLSPYERRVIRKDGSMIICELIVTQVQDAEGNPVSIQTIARDVSPRIQRQRSLQSSLSEMTLKAVTDPLTQIFNRRAVEGVARRWSIENQISNRPFSIILIDLDLLKKLNDTYGHEAGDQALKHVAQNMEDGKRSSDISGRWAGDEFIIFLPDTGLFEAQIVANRISINIATEEIKVEDQHIPVSVCIGVAGTNSSIEASSDLDEIIRNADKALYKAKNLGGNQVQVYHKGEMI